MYMDIKVVTGPHICVCALSIKMKNYRIKCQFIRHLLKTCIFWIKLGWGRLTVMRKGPCLGGNPEPQEKEGGKCITWMGGGWCPYALNCDLGSYVDNDFPLTKMGKLWEMVILERKRLTLQTWAFWATGGYTNICRYPANTWTHEPRAREVWG